MQAILKRLFSLRRPTIQPEWTTERIDNEDFRAHFTYASDVVAQWIGGTTDIEHCRIADFGCGDGVTSLALALRHRMKEVHGIDIHDSHRYLEQQAKAQLNLKRLPTNLHFHTVTPGSPLAGRFPVDAIASWSVFEHIDRDLLPGIFADLYTWLPPAGVLFIQVDPLYYSPTGSHLNAFIRQPWAHLLNDEAEIVRMMETATPEDAPGVAHDMAYQTKDFQEFKEFLLSEFRTLNRITADQIVELGTAAGFVVLREERRRTDIPPEPRLLEQHGHERLTTREIRVLFQK